MVNKKEIERKTAAHRDVLLTMYNDWGILKSMERLAKEQEEFFTYDQTLNYLLERAIKEFLKE